VTPPPQASVIVCTRNRAQSLEGSLARMIRQQPALAWELIVVDNASTDATATVVASIAEKATNVPVRHLLEEQMGLSHARNRGVAEARGAYLLFTDDDVLVEPGWVDALCAGFAEHDVAGIAGKVVPNWLSPPPRWLAGRTLGLLAITDFGDEPRDLGEHEVPVGASMAIRASLLDPAVPPFDPELGHRGTTYFAYEEYDLLLSLRQQGRLVYRPDAVALHQINPERTTWPGMRRASLHNGYGSRLAERRRGAGRIPLRTSLPALARAYVAMRRHTRRNAARDDLEPDVAFEELVSYWELGRSIETTFGASPLGTSLIGRLA
jgi:glucosyl-dolichyl phosphate glucuronosyltransferase